MTAQLVAEVVTSLGHWVEIASGVDQAVALAAANVPAVMLVDLHLGAESGLDLISELAVEPLTAGIPIIAMTALDDPEVFADLDRAGVVAMLEKPFAAADIAAMVQAVLDAGPK
ncbi:MAG: response regulator [Alphaproteobacteria bacterium]|nr:response regulator [Alphaproteobacteria bacterium]